MWGDKTIFALDQDGGEHEIKYSDIVSYNESTELNEEYIELMRIDDPLDGIKDAWMEWKNGPATEQGDIRPAQKELIGYINSWLKKNIK